MEIKHQKNSGGFDIFIKFKCHHWNVTELFYSNATHVAKLGIISSYHPPVQSQLVGKHCEGGGWLLLLLSLLSFI